jgi:hypothetical protein
MELNIICRKSALKHGITEADIRHAIKTACYDGPVEGYDNKYLLLGFDTKANPIEVIYNEFGEHGMNVFHAMNCQPMYLALLSG